MRGGCRGDRTTATAPAHPDTRAQRILVVVGIVVLAFNLRPAAVSVGPVLDEITTGLGMSSHHRRRADHAARCCPSPASARWPPGWPGSSGCTGSRCVALVSVVVGLVLRSQTGNVPVFLLLSLLALAGMATANVLLPSLVKLHFPDRVGLMTSIYTTSLAIGLTLASVPTVPIAQVRVVAVGLASSLERKLNSCLLSQPLFPSANCV